MSLSSPWEASRTERTCIIGSFYKILFLGCSRAIVPASSAEVLHPAALPTSHLAGVVTGAPPQGGKEDTGPKRTQDSCSCHGERQVCAGVQLGKPRRVSRGSGALRGGGRSITNQEPSRGSSFGPARSEAVTSQALGILKARAPPLRPHPG